MRSAIYVVCLLLSLPNVIGGFAFAVLHRTFRTRNPFDIALDFLQSVVWGMPAVAAVLLVLLIAGIIAASRPYAALCALALNAAALALVISRIGPPKDADEALIFLPVTIAVIGLAFVAYRDLKKKSPIESPSR